MYTIIAFRGPSRDVEDLVTAKLLSFLYSHGSHFPVVYPMNRNLILAALETGPGKQEALVALGQFLDLEGDGCAFMVARNHVGWLPHIRPAVSSNRLRAVVNYGD